MLVDSGYLAAFLVGLLGGVHCVGMCGGIVAALSLGLPEQAGRKSWPLLLGYNLGRIASYSVAGAMMGGVGLLAVQLSDLHQVQLVLQLFAALMMIVLGLYLAGWWFGLNRVERLGGKVWALMEPLGRRFLPVKTPQRALLLGSIWGWLPCGMVYSVLIWALAAGEPLKGALLLFSFGLGTLPNLLAMGLFAHRLRRWVQSLWLRRLAGLLVIFFGLLSLWRAVAEM
ncbi:MAG: sulfite exporter TauE/SafE family protein [Gammaproteobacteria bacterium]|nr:sulfite exporter TauE/SafE family protein [Gammaproteobacteria bacterium]